MPPRTTRRRYWIDVRTQGPFLLKFCIIWAAGLGLLCALLYYLADEELGRSFYSVHATIRNTWRILLPAVIVSGAVSSFLSIGAAAWVAIRESHRVAGPALRLRRLFARLAEGDLGAEVRLRRGDALEDLAGAYRAALAANRERLAALQDLARRSEEAARALRDTLAGAPLSEAERALVDDAVLLAARVREAAAAFRTGDA